jgi:hypothetical protein
LFEPLEPLEKLAALTPRPRIDRVLYHGVLAPHADWRARVVAYSALLVETRAAASESTEPSDDTAAAPKLPRCDRRLSVIRAAQDVGICSLRLGVVLLLVKRLRAPPEIPCRLVVRTVRGERQLYLEPVVRTSHLTVPTSEWGRSGNSVDIAFAPVASCTRVARVALQLAVKFERRTERALTLGGESAG